MNDLAQDMDGTCAAWQAEIEEGRKFARRVMARWNRNIHEPYVRKPILRNAVSVADFPDFDNPKPKTHDELIAENERLQGLAAKYWVLRDAINWQIKAGKHVPKAVRMIFEAQMAEINESIGAA